MPFGHLYETRILDILVKGLVIYKLAYIKSESR